MAIFTCLDDPKDGPFLKLHGIADEHLVKYIVERASGVSAEEAFERFSKGRFATQGDAEHFRHIVEQFPIPT
jgi:hypothetical protein